MFTNTYLPHVGGVANSVARFTEDLRRLGHRVLVLAPSYPRSGETDATDPDVVRVPAIQRFNGSDFSMRIQLPFIIDEQIDRFGPDLIHSHHPYLLGDAAVRASKRRCLPLIFTHHTRYEEYTHYVTAGSEKMKHLAAHLATEYANMCDFVVTPSASIEGLIRERGVATPTACIPTGVDVAHFASGDGSRFRKRQGLSEKTRIIGHVGRLAPEKNLAFLGQAVASALKRCTDAVLVLIGDGPAGADIAAAFQAARIEDRLLSAGQLSGRSLADAYRAMDLFAFASLSETQGMVLTEAMAAGVPVFALDAPGVREVVSDGQNGRLLNAGTSSAEFARALVKALENDRWRQAMIEGARTTARDFDRRTCAEKLVALYERACAASRRGSPDADCGFKPWDTLLNAIRTEWDLLSQKASALAAAFSDEGPRSPKESETD